MTRATFGAPFSFTYYPEVDGDALDLTSVDPPDIYIFSFRPGRAEARYGTGSLAHISSWTDVPKGKRVDVPAIPDPYPDAEGVTVEYFAALNFSISTGGQVQTDIRPLLLARLSGQSLAVGTTEELMRALFPDLSRYVSTEDAITSIEQAEREVRALFRDKGIQWARINRPDLLTDTVTYRALSISLAAKSRREGDHLDQRAKSFGKTSERLYSSLSLDYGEYEGGAQEVLELTKDFYFLLR